MFIRGFSNLYKMALAVFRTASLLIVMCAHSADDVFWANLGPQAYRLISRSWRRERDEEGSREDRPWGGPEDIFYSMVVPNHPRISTVTLPQTQCYPMLGNPVRVPRMPESYIQLCPHHSIMVRAYTVFSAVSMPKSHQRHECGTGSEVGTSGVVTVESGVQIWRRDGVVPLGRVHYAADVSKSRGRRETVNWQ
jgi:hypothetical protein